MTAMEMENQLLIVDDEPNVIRSLQRELRGEGYVIHSANSGKAGLNLMKVHHVGVVLSDYMMPHMDGITFLGLASQQNPDAVRMLLTGHSSLDNAMEAINRLHIFGYLTKPWSSEDLKRTVSRAFEHHNLVVENKKLQKLTEKRNRQLTFVNENLEGLVHERTVLLEEAIREGILMLALAAEAKDDDTGEHIHRIERLTQDICIGLGMSSKESREIAFSSIMHDVGKINIPDSILKKPGKLNADEWRIMQSHCIAGERILGNKPFYKAAREIARSHHEQWGGKGYPDGLKGDSIPLAARIVTVADVFDALTHERPYKKAWPVEKAIQEMETASGEMFDPDVLAVFLKITTEGSCEARPLKESSYGYKI